MNNKGFRRNSQMLNSDYIKTSRKWSLYEGKILYDFTKLQGATLRRWFLYTIDLIDI